MLAICRYHRNSNGWNDIGYNALVDKYGTIYEGRAGGLDQAVIGAQAQGFNAADGGHREHRRLHERRATPERARRHGELHPLEAHRARQPLSGPVTLTSAGGSASRYPAGAQVTVERVLGHRDTGKTACPGDALYAQLDQIRALVVSGTPFAAPSARVTAALADYSVDYGEVVPVSGVLVGPDGNPLAGQAVDLQVNSDNAWRTSRRLTTGADGSFATRAEAPQAHVRARALPGRADVRGAPRPRLLLHLRPVLSFGARPPRGPRPARHGGGHGGAAEADRERGLPAADPRPLAQGGRGARCGPPGRFSTSFVPAFRASYRYYAVTPSDLDTDRGARAKPCCCRCAELPALLQVLAVEAVARGQHPRRLGRGCAGRGAASGAPRTRRRARSARATGARCGR